MSNAILIKSEEVARKEVGYREGPKNNETKFGKWFGMDQVAWCAIFMSWVSAHSGTTYFGKPWRFASTIAARAHAQKNGRWTTTPTVGTIAMMAHSSTTGHVGEVIYILRRSGRIIVGTIEGNTNDQGAREGNGVWLRERDSSSWNGYIVLDQTYANDPGQPNTDPPMEEWMKNCEFMITPDGGGIIIFDGFTGKVCANGNEFNSLVSNGWAKAHNKSNDQERMGQDLFNFLMRK